MDTISDNHPGNCDECFRELLIKWLRQGGKSEMEIHRAVKKNEMEIHRTVEKNEMELDRAAKKTATKRAKNSGTAACKHNNIIVIPAVAFSIIIILGISYFIVSIVLKDILINSSAMTLKMQYNKQRLTEFTMGYSTYNMPFLNVTMKTKKSTIPVWKFIKSIDHDAMSQKGQIRHLLLGPTGAGKTTLMRYLAKVWAQGRALRSCQILFLIHLNSSSNPQSLSALLQMSPHKTHLEKYLNQISKEIESRNGTGACFLLDADHDNEWHQRDDFVYKLFFENLLRSSICILASRPSFYGERVGIEVFEIVGFSGAHMQHYLDLHTMSKNENVTLVLDLWNTRPIIRDICRLPLNMAIIVSLAKDDRNFTFHTNTEIYLAFIVVAFEFHLKDHPRLEWNAQYLRHCMLYKPNIGNNLCTAIQHLLNVAYDMHFNGNETFPEPEHQIKSSINKFGFVSITKVNLNRVKYEFFHPTFLEFFAAYYLLSLPKEDRLYLYIKEQQSKHQVNHNVWIFFFGLVSEHYSKKDVFPDNNISVIVRQFAVYHSEQEIEQFPPYCQNGWFLEYVKETQWNEKEFSEPDLLSSAGIVVNSALFTLCGDKPDTSLNTLLYILEHDTDLHTLMLDDVGNAHTDIIDMLQMTHAEHILIRHNLSLEFNASKNFSMYLHMSLKANADYHEMMIDRLNTESFMKYMLSGNILGNLFLEENTMIDKIMKQVPPEELFSYDQRSMPPLFNMTTKHIELWKSLNALISSLENLYQNNIEFFCETFQMLVNHLKLKEAISYTFDLKIDLGKDLGMSREVSDSCLELVSSLDKIIDHNNIKLQKLTLIFPSAYFKTRRDEVIPRKLNMTGLKHLSIHFPKSVMVDCYKLLDEVSKFKEMLTLEIQHCLLRPQSNPWTSTQSARISSTYLPHTLQELTLGRSGLTDEDVRSVLVKLIDSTQELTSLSLPNNYITKSGLNMLVNALKSHGEFTSLDLSGNPITERNGLETLNNQSYIRELKLSNCSIGDTEIKMLVDALESNLNLHSLNLSENPFIGSERGLEPLARLTNLRHLDISGWQHRHGHCHVVEVGECIESHTHIEALEKLTELRFLKLCSKNDPPICWSKKMASVISHLPHLQVFNAPCLVTNN